MANPFQGWTQAMLDAHNARVANKSKEVRKTESQIATTIDRRSGAVTTGGAKSAQNTRTNLVPTKTTDEDGLNKLERDWLRVLRLTHPSVGIQNIQLKLADDTRYTPDFNVVDANGQLVFYETKGHMRDDARVKLFVAARSFLHFRFVLVTRTKGAWKELPVNP